jgi:hypothetical protein
LYHSGLFKYNSLTFLCKKYSVNPTLLYAKCFSSPQVTTWYLPSVSLLRIFSIKAMPTIPRPTTKILVRVWGGGGFERVVAVVEDESEGEDGRDEVDPEAEAEDEDVVGGTVMMGRVSGSFDVVQIECEWDGSRKS